MYDAFCECLQGNNILCNGQSYNLQLLEPLQEWSPKVDKDEGCDIICLDYTKAINTAHYERLHKKQETMGMTGKILHWSGNFLCSRQQRVVVEGECSSWSHESSGLSQGSVLGPVLMIYINDLHKCVSCRIRMYADDTKYFSTINCLTDVDYLQQNADKLI